MADHVDQINMSDAILSANTFNVKQEQCQGDSFIDDKVCISETGITVDNAEVKCTSSHGKIKQCEESTCLDNIKTELTSVEVTAAQNEDDNVKIEGGISTDIKIDFDNGLLYCEHCEAYYIDYCIECGMLVNILNKNAMKSADNGIRADIPNDILEIQDLFGQTGTYALRIIPKGVKFGPFTGIGASECPWEMKGEKFVLDKNKSKYLNWMKFVNPTRNTSEGNLRVFQYEDNTYYQSTRQIPAGDELLVYFDEEYCQNKIDIADIVKDIFACTFCCLGFSSKSHLAKHKTLCVEDAAGKFSLEDLAQCPFCKIHFGSKEYLEHHKAFCFERNARKGILPTPQPKHATTALNERKRSLRQIYKCEQCNYRTKYQSDLKKHTSNHHYEVKKYKCGICNRRFKTKEFLRMHAENKHASVRGKDGRQHSTINYRNTQIKIEQSSSRDQKKVFKCSLCVFRAKRKETLMMHIKTKHLKEFDYECDSCDYRTNYKTSFERHMKIRHLKEFSYKCNLCEYRTNIKTHLERHIKTRHLKEFRYKCDSCEFRTNSKTYLEKHIKTRHLKVFDYNCDSCEYRTNYKTSFERHMKTRHLKEFSYKCDSREFRTNNKTYLEKHIKSKRLTFNCKYDSCTFTTDNKGDLKIHIKANHLKKLDFKCDYCEYESNSKQQVEIHINTKHLKGFCFKCDSCEYETNFKNNLEIHLKNKHLSNFDFKCDSCDYYSTNHRSHLVRHINSKHLTFDCKYDSCTFTTDNKGDLKMHVKSKHLK